MPERAPCCPWLMRPERNTAVTQLHGPVIGIEGQGHRHAGRRSSILPASVIARRGSLLTLFCRDRPARAKVH